MDWVTAWRLLILVAAVAFAVGLIYTVWLVENEHQEEHWR